MRFLVRLCVKFWSEDVEILETKNSPGKLGSSYFKIEIINEIKYFGPAIYYV